MLRATGILICTVIIKFITDGHHKLIRWRMVTHAGIGDFSRIIVFMKCSNNNKAATVYDCFLEGVHQYGLPSRVRSDRGRENCLMLSTGMWF